MFFLIRYWLILYRFCVFFFFKQKTAYERRISDWSSYGCSSDRPALPRDPRHPVKGRGHDLDAEMALATRPGARMSLMQMGFVDHHQTRRRQPGTQLRSEERRVGKECVSTYRSWCRTVN